MKIINGSNSPVSISYYPSQSTKSLNKIVDMLGRETKEIKNLPLFYIYDDGTTERKIIFE